MTTTAPPRPTLPTIALLAAAIRAYDAAHQHATCDACGASWTSAEGTVCRWCAARARANTEYILKPPERRGYGYATPDDLAHLGIDPRADRDADLRAWIDDLRIAVNAGIITQRQKNDAIRRAKTVNARGAAGAV